jgi:hypothetical protein
MFLTIRPTQGVYIFVYCCKLGQRDSLACPIDLKACITLICLLSGRFNTLVRVLKSLAIISFQKNLFSSPHTSFIIELRGSSHYLSIFYLNPPRVTWDSPLVLDSSFTKSRGGFI